MVFSYYIHLGFISHDVCYAYLVHHWIVVDLSLEDQNKVCFDAIESVVTSTNLWCFDGMSDSLYVFML